MNNLTGRVVPGRRPRPDGDGDDPPDLASDLRPRGQRRLYYNPVGIGAGRDHDLHRRRAVAEAEHASVRSAGQLRPLSRRGRSVTCPTRRPPSLAAVCGFDGDGALAAITPPVTDAPSYGEVYAFNETGDALALTTQNTPYRWVAHTGTLVKGTGYVTWNDAAAPTGKRLTVGASGRGSSTSSPRRSLVTSRSTPTCRWTCISTQAPPRTSPATSMSPRTGRMSRVLPPGYWPWWTRDTVTMWFTASIGSNSINVKHANLSIVRIDA